MNRLAVSTLALALVAASGSAFADDRYNDSRYDSDYRSAYNEDGPRYDVAQVTNVSPIIEQDRPTQRQECWNEPARGNSGYDNRGYDNRGYDNRGYGNTGQTRNNMGGTVLGAIIGGALGNQAGKGDGRKAATIAGAVIGGAIGNNVARGNDRPRDSRYGYNDGYNNGGTVQRCRTVSDGYQSEQRVVGYNVTYRYAGQTYHTTTAYHPGKTLRVEVNVRPTDEAHVATRY
ncbi:glycine zipper 2TM domain-containing protein [Arenimonas oryziterrae]|uniref:Glycine zipper 2TM domain-containing protein n=1 Tax=Arenimonas oryziterrae DSM 21050 = YC6267 TaxID=1121015 RepID=A0A091B0G7_9GAMM|nr:glycine zipper 2TM domain-containing protein [Arenimonas oryziterrae]KFN45047.1 hypothetical protein N789_03230 [Arenimonas oryziterrae DSM 21050 = YC6267]